MANLLLSSKLAYCFSYHSHRTTRTISATTNVPNNRLTQISTPIDPKLPIPCRANLVAELDDYLSNNNNNNNTSSAAAITTNTTRVEDHPYYSSINDYNSSREHIQSTPSNFMEVVKLHMIMEIIADRLEMHKNVAEQRNNWNHLLLTSINMITLSAATMSGLAAIAAGSTSSIAPLVTLKVSSTILYMAAAGLLAVMNYIQPSQLAEEQRNAARLFKQLHGELRTALSVGSPTAKDVDEAMEKVLALDKAFPLPLLGAMLDKFPPRVEPAVWWPQRKQRHYGRRSEKGLLMSRRMKGKKSSNGWDAMLEEEMKEIASAVKKKDMAEYLRLGNQVLNLNKMFAVSGPVLTGLAALGSLFIGPSMKLGANLAVMVGVIGGALASVVNTLEHGGQAGMVFELYRGTSGFFKLMEETILLNINEQDPNKRQNGELLEIKVALQLGRSLSELRQFAADKDDSCDEFASKLF